MGSGAATAPLAAIQKLVTLSVDRIQAARAVMVNGETRISVAARLGVSPQAIAKTVNLVWAKFTAYLAAKAAEGGND